MGKYLILFVQDDAGDKQNKPPAAAPAAGEAQARTFPCPLLVDRGPRVNVCVCHDTPNPTRGSRFPLPNHTLAGGALPSGATFMRSWLAH